MLHMKYMKREEKQMITVAKTSPGFYSRIQWFNYVLYDWGLCDFDFAAKP